MVVMRSDRGGKSTPLPWPTTQWRKVKNATNANSTQWRKGKTATHAVHLTHATHICKLTGGGEKPKQKTQGRENQSTPDSK